MEPEHLEALGVIYGLAAAEVRCDRPGSRYLRRIGAELTPEAVAVAAIAAVGGRLLAAGDQDVPVGMADGLSAVLLEGAGASLRGEQEATWGAVAKLTEAGSSETLGCGAELVAGLTGPRGEPECIEAITRLCLSAAHLSDPGA